MLKSREKLVLSVNSMLAIKSTCGFCYSDDNYSKFVSEGVVFNFIGVFAALYGVLVLYMVNELDYKRVALPEDEMALTGSD